jgi:hypothetical protein
MVHIRRNEGRGVAILEPAGEIDVTLVETIKNSIAGLVQEGYSRLILDCKGCRVQYLIQGSREAGPSASGHGWVALPGPDPLQP